MTRYCVINFGSPRSGTTVAHKMLRRGLPDVFCTKLPEQAANHPCWCPPFTEGTTDSAERGLLWLSRWLAKDPVVFLRTVRHPLEIAESFVATRTDGLVRKTPELSSYSNPEVARWMLTESRNFHRQRKALTSFEKTRRHYVVEMRYEQMASSAYRKELAGEICRHVDEDPAALTRVFHETWGKIPARVGRLSEGLGSVMTDNERAWFTERLAQVVEREGYR